MNFNYGFTNYEEKDVKIKIFDFTNETIGDILNKLFKWKNIDESYYDYITDNYNKRRPLTVNVNLKRFLSCPDKNVLKEALKTGEVDYQYRDSLITLSVVTEDKELIKLLYFEEKIEHFYKTKGEEFLIEWLRVTDLIEHRKRFLSLGRYDFLELLDNKLFIQNS